MKRAVLIVVLGLLSAVLPDVATPEAAWARFSEVPVTFAADGDWNETEVISQPITMVGLSWDEGSRPQEVWFRTRAKGDPWSAWANLPVSVDHGPDPGTTRVPQSTCGLRAGLDRAPDSGPVSGTGRSALGSQRLLDRHNGPNEATPAPLRRLLPPQDRDGRVRLPRPTHRHPPVGLGPERRLPRRRCRPARVRPGEPGVHSSHRHLKLLFRRGRGRPDPRHLHVPREHPGLE